MLMTMNAESLVAEVACPTLVLVATEAVIIDSSQARSIAERAPRAELVEIPSRDGFPVMPQDVERWTSEMRRFLTGEAAAVQLNRILQTVLFTDIVSSTASAAAKGDHRWRSVLDGHDEIARSMVGRFGGRIIKSTGDGILATLDSPAQSVRCAQAIRDAVKDVGIEIRAGLHTGEIELRDDDIGGTAVNIARRVCDSADANEVRVSETVTQVVAGSGLQFDDLGPHELKGVPGTWRLYRARD
jgi:class 3 adenylate cyclase